MKQFDLTSVSDAAIREAIAKAKAHHEATGEHVQVMKAGICYFVQNKRLYDMSLGDAIKLQLS